MKKYSKEFKNNIIARMLRPNNTPVPRLAIETGVPRDTLYCWRLTAIRNGGEVADNKNTGCNNPLSGEEKLAIVMETANLNEHELSEYCRKKGLYPVEVNVWRDNCAQANRPYCPKADRKKARKQAKLIKELQVEVRRKDRALAETAALLVLQKKSQFLWVEPEDVKSSLLRGDK